MEPKIMKVIFSFDKFTESLFKTIIKLNHKIYIEEQMFTLIFNFDEIRVKENQTNLLYDFK